MHLRQRGAADSRQLHAELLQAVVLLLIIGVETRVASRFNGVRACVRACQCYGDNDNDNDTRAGVMIAVA